MAEKSTFFNSVNGDRKYTAEDMAAHFAKMLTNGVMPAGTQLQVIEGGGMNIAVSAGSAWINGYAYHNDASFVLAIDPADGVLNRVDRIVVRWSKLARSINLTVLKGVPASSAAAPEIVRNADYYDIGIATINVNKGITAITQALITDTRMDSDVCGFVSSLIQPDTSGWFVQFETAFNEWFDGVKDTLGDNAAGQLQNQINQLKTDDDQIRALETKLPDDLATALGLDPTDNPQVKDGFEQFTKYWWKRNLIKQNAIIGDTYTDFEISVRYNRSAVTEIYYSDQINILGERIELNNPSLANISYDDYKLANLLRNKYIKLDDGVTIVYGKSDGEATRVSYQATNVHIVKFPVTLVNSGDISFEYISSSNSNAYPENEILGSYYYIKLNNFFENALNTLNFEKGHYIGTGTYGSENKNNLVLSFRPTIVIVIGEKTDPKIMINPSPHYSGTEITTEWNKNNVSWYNFSSKAQLNNESELYYYITLGFKE